MLRLWGQRWLRVLISSPALPVAVSPSEVDESTGDDHAIGDDGQTGDGDECADSASPLTYGKVFGAIPRMTKAINTPTINQKISVVFGLPALDNSMEFKKIYSSGREALRQVQSNSTQPNIALVGLDTKMALHITPPTHRTSMAAISQ